jgi:hypothetical protein
MDPEAFRGAWRSGAFVASPPRYLLTAHSRPIISPVLDLLHESFH